MTAPAAVNARYPGCTRERCWLCDAETGRAGLGDDSIYDAEFNGPYCEACWAGATAAEDPAHD